MVSDGFERVRALDAPAVVVALRHAGGPHVELVRPLAGGAVGAWLVRWPDGHEGVLTWLAQPAQLDVVERGIAITARAAAAGVPVPRYEAIVALDDGIALLQDFARGVPATTVTDGLVDALLDLADRRRGILAGTTEADHPMPLHLRRPGPGFCLHEPLRAHSPATAAVLAAIQAATPADDALHGTDAVHLDYHVGNVLVDPDDPGRITAVVDWGGACAGRVELDLATLAFDLTWRSPGRLQQRVEQHLVDTAPPDVFRAVWAHASLRLLDWSIRHYPEHVDAWLAVARRHLDP